jgi:hypothetical protein
MNALEGVKILDFAPVESGPTGTDCPRGSVRMSSRLDVEASNTRP